MKEKLFFQLEDVREIRQSISEHLNNFHELANEVMLNYVEPLLGGELYALMQLDLEGGFASTTRFKELLEGTQYVYQGRTYIYRGLKLYACYLWLYMYLLEGGLQITPIGAQLFRDEESENADNMQQQRQLRDHCIRSADRLEDGVIHFLRKDNRFPEYLSGDEIEPAEESNFSWRSTNEITQEVPFNRFHR